MGLLHMAITCSGFTLKAITGSALDKLHTPADMPHPLTWVGAVVYKKPPHFPLSDIWKSPVLYWPTAQLFEALELLHSLTWT